MAMPTFFSRIDLRCTSSLSLVLPILLVTTDLSASDSGVLYAPRVDQPAGKTLEGLFPFMGLRFAQQIEFDSIPIRKASPAVPATPTRLDSDRLTMIRNGVTNAPSPLQSDDGRSLAVKSFALDDRLPSNTPSFDAEVTELTTDALGIDPEESAAANQRPREVVPVRLPLQPNDTRNRSLEQESREQPYATDSTRGLSESLLAKSGTADVDRNDSSRSLDDEFAIPSIMALDDAPSDTVEQPEPRAPQTRQGERDADSSVLPIGLEQPGAPPSSDRSAKWHTVRPSIAMQARQYINDGIELAQRGAIYSSRARFIKVLRLVSQALDVESGSAQHSTALAAGLRALEEAKQLRPPGSQVEGNVSLDRILMAHRTPVLRDRGHHYISAIEAVQAYHTYAEQQLAIAGGRELVAADALFGLAKLQPHLNLSNGDSLQTGPMAMSYYQSALMIYPDHFLSANELGVMFARYGQLADARAVLRFGASTAPTFPDLWLNLARVHERLGEGELAQMAMDEYKSLHSVGRSPTTVARRLQVDWVDPATFAADGFNNGQPGPVVRPAESRAARRATQSHRSWPFR